jgi:tRNA G46 methylase TrmB
MQAVPKAQMYANSRTITSRQSAPHARLRDVVLRHLDAAWRREPSAVGRDAFDSIRSRLTHPRLILDAGCGTGESTLALARQFPEAQVIGVDKSAARLAVGQRAIDAGTAPPNAVLLRCDLVDFWQLAAHAQLRLERQFVLYPNPWPKPEHLRRRWHAHPVLPTILALGGAIELRTNWHVYAEEFAMALRLCGLRGECSAWTADPPLTPFERKYAASGHALWRWRAAAALTEVNAVTSRGEQWTCSQDESG